MNDKPVFKIWPLDAADDRRDRILHRNMLFSLQSKVQMDIGKTTAVLSEANQLMNWGIVDFSGGDKHSAYVNF